MQVQIRFQQLLEGKAPITKLNNISTKAVEHVKLNNSLNLAIENEHKDYQYVLSK